MSSAGLVCGSPAREAREISQRMESIRLTIESLEGSMDSLYNRLADVLAESCEKSSPGGQCNPSTPDQTHLGCELSGFLSRLEAMQGRVNFLNRQVML